MLIEARPSKLMMDGLSRRSLRPCHSFCRAWAKMGEAVASIAGERLNAFSRGLARMSTDCEVYIQEDARVV